DAADLHADIPAGDQDLWHRPSPFRHHHDPESRHWPADAAGRTDHGCRLRDWKSIDGGRLEKHYRLLHSNDHGALFGHVYSGALSLVAASGAGLNVGGLEAIRCPP